MSDTPPRRILMTLDAVGGVWRYAADLAQSLGERGIEVVLAGLGPSPSEAQQREIELLPNAQLVWLGEPLDWLVDDERELDALPERLCRLAKDFNVDLLHLNVPSQAYGLSAPCPIVVASHSCVVTWWRAVKGGPLPAEWQWQKRRNRGGFDAADVVLAPSASHAALLRTAYGPIEKLRVVPNAAAPAPSPKPKEKFVFAAARWWDEGKNGRVLDEAAQFIEWPVLVAGACQGPNGQNCPFQHAKPLGERPNAEIRDFLARAEIAVSPSLYEPFGLVALEAAQAGAALVLADIPTYRELWGGAALFPDPHSPEAFAAAINRLASDDTLRREFGRRARLRADRFSQAAQAEAVIAAYRAAAKEPESPLALAG